MNMNFRIEYFIIMAGHIGTGATFARGPRGRCPRKGVGPS
jgi:hypothetical protein